jgi:DNA-binding response OmpR family regulator
MNLQMAVGETTAKWTNRQSKIMIVDDDPDLCQALVLRLRSNQYETVSAGDAYSAMALARRERPDLILMDLGLPGRDGFAVIQTLQEYASLTSIPVIILSGRDLRGCEKQILESRAFAFFQKPANNEDLLACVRHCLNGERGAQVMEAPRAMETGAENQRARQATIMVVDDDPNLRLALSLRLRANHYRTVSAPDGYSALALAQRECPDLILLDLGLPGFATGADVLKHVRTFPSLAAIPVIILTARDARDYEKPMRELGAAGYFQKPVDNQLLLDLIRYCLPPDKKKEGLSTIRLRRDSKRQTHNDFSKGRSN